MKYTKAQKLAAIKDYLAGNRGLRDTAKRHGVDLSALRSWIPVYQKHGESGLTRRKPGARYSAEFKLKVLKHMHTHALSGRQVAAAFNIRKIDLVNEWQRRYDQGGFAALSPRNNVGPRKMNKTPDPNERSPDDANRTREDLLKELERLRMENAYLKKLDALVQELRPSARKSKCSR